MDESMLEKKKSTNKHMTDAAMKKSQSAIRKAHNAMDTVEFEAQISIHDNKPKATLIKNVMVELLIVKTDRSGIRFTCSKDSDAEILKERGLSYEYSIKEAKLIYNELKDYQSTYKELAVKPLTTKTYITIRLLK